MRVKPVELTDRQLDRLSEFCSNLSLLLLSSIVIPELFGFDKALLPSLIFGLTAATFSLVLSLLLIRKKRK